MPAADAPMDNDQSPYASNRATQTTSTSKETAGTGATDNRSAPQVKATSNDRPNVGEDYASARSEGTRRSKDPRHPSHGPGGRDSGRGNDKTSRNAGGRESSRSRREQSDSSHSHYHSSSSSSPPKGDDRSAPARTRRSESKDRRREASRTATGHLPKDEENTEDVVMVYYDERASKTLEQQREQSEPQSPSARTPMPGGLNYAAATAGGVQHVPPQPYPNDSPSMGSSSASAQAAATEQIHGAGYTKESSSWTFKGLITGSSGPRDKAKEAALQHAQDTNKYLSSELTRAHGANQTFKKQRDEARHELTRAREYAQGLDNELKNVHRELEDYRVLSEVRGKELLGAQVFLTKADMLSVSELTQKVADLNDETFQAAASLGDSLVRVDPVQWPTEDVKQETYRYVCSIIGQPMFQVMHHDAKEPSPNVLLVQLFLQAYLTRFCCVKIERWYENNNEANHILASMYREIRETEEQAVSGRWRAITHAKARPSTENWANEFFLDLMEILKCTSLGLQSDAHKAFQAKLTPIFKAILDLRISLGEQFTSADIEPFVVNPGTPFDPRHMEDALDDGRSNGSKQGIAGPGSGTLDSVVATSGIGLKERLSREARRQNGSEYRPTALPKVILQSTLQELLAPPPPRKNKSASSRGAK